CPWDREQTHESLLPYVVEEAHELVEAVETGSREDLLEELGDVLLQVVFHARLAQEDAAAPFDLDDVARRTAAKLVSRHPHVFGDVHAPDAEAVKARWDQLKKAEKGRESALDGVPPGLGAPARAAKLASRAQRAGLETHVADDGAALGDDVKVPDLSAVPVGVPRGLGARARAAKLASRAQRAGLETHVADDGAALGDDVKVPDVSAVPDGGAVGAALLRLTLEATAAGIDAEAELRAATRR